MASSNPIFKDEDLATLEEEMEKAAALAKAARRAMNLNILFFREFNEWKNMLCFVNVSKDIQVIQVEVVVMTMQQPLHIL